MALTTNLPPQAYTRDTLVKAIEWLTTQPASVKARATTADVIVSFYMQAARRNAVQNEAPVSGETFKADLKALANDLKMFEEPIAPPQTSAPGRLEPIFPNLGPAAQVVQPVPTPVAPPTPLPIAPPRLEAVPRPEPPSAPKPVTWTVDERSLSAARELKDRFNLSNEQEALRMLVTLGSQKMKDSFPG